jgi:hypothetical protein
MLTQLVAEPLAHDVPAPAPKRQQGTRLGVTIAGHVSMAVQGRRLVEEFAESIRIRARKETKS